MKLMEVLSFFSAIIALLGYQAAECMGMNQAEADKLYTPPYCSDNAETRSPIDYSRANLNESTALSILQDVLNRINSRPVLDINKISPTPSSLKLADGLCHLFTLKVLTQNARLIGLERDISALFDRMNYGHDCFVNKDTKNYFHIIKSEFEQNSWKDAPCFDEKYDLMVWGSLLCLAISGHWLTPFVYNEVDHLREKLDTHLKDISMEILKQHQELFRDPKEEETVAVKNMLNYLNGHGIAVNDVKFVALGPAPLERDININLDGTEKFCNTVVEIFCNIYPQSRSFQQLLTKLPPKFSIRQEKENSYRSFRESIDLKFDIEEPMYTLFNFPGAKADTSGRYLFHLNGTKIGWKAYPMWHELGHMTYHLPHELFKILDDKSDLTMDVALNIFDDKAKATVKKTLKASIDLAKSVYGEDYPTIIHGKPVVLKDLHKYLEECCASKKGIARLLFSEEEEVSQLLGFRVCNRTMYVQELCDLKFLAELGLPIRTDHSAMLDSPQDLLLGASYPEKYVDFRNLGYNREFMDLLFQIHGLDMNKYEEKLKNMDETRFI